MDKKLSPESRISLPMVLVADSSTTRASWMTAALVTAGYTVASACTGEQTLELLTRLRPSVLVIDEALAPESGANVARTVRARNPGLPLILLISRDLYPLSTSAGTDWDAWGSPFR